MQRFDGQSLPETGPLLFVLRCPFSHLYFGERLDHLVQDIDFELYLRHNAFRIIDGWHNVKMLAIPPWHRLSNYIETLG